MIPVCRPTLKGNEKKYVNECLDTNWISSNGKFIKMFEEKFSKYCGGKYGISCSSGTAALHIALRALNIGKGDEVIVPTFTMIATTNAIHYVGAKPVYVDSEMKTWNIDIDKIEGNITDKTKAIMVVHTYGCPVDMDRIMKIAKKHNLKVIEDAAEAHGAEYKGKKVGSIGHIGCFSFYGNKIITTGEGGMVVTNDKELAEKCKSLRNHCFTEPRFIHYDIGYNYRMTNIQAAIGLAQLENISNLVTNRGCNAALYNLLLRRREGITLPPECTYGRNVYWMYGILIDPDKFGKTKDEVMEGLKKKGIQTRSFFYPAHRQPAYKIEDGVDYPIADYLFEHGLYLPSASDLTSVEISEVCNELNRLKK
jgi:perosamine synthetase